MYKNIELMREIRDKVIEILAIILVIFMIFLNNVVIFLSYKFNVYGVGDVDFLFLY